MSVERERPVNGRRRYLRFTLSDRFEHWLQMASFTVLAVTGLVQKFAENNLSEFLIAGMGGIETVRLIHRVAAVFLMVGVVYHIGAVGYKLYVLNRRPSILLSWEDFQDAWNTLLYNLGRRERKPQFDRYSFDEKFEYWAFVWGTVVMVITGFMLWNPIAAAEIFPGQFIPAAKAAHGGEALLAVLAIIVWHMYHVHVRHFNRSMFTGYLTEEEMLEDHPRELADIKAGIRPRPVDPELVQARRRRYVPAFGVVALALLAGIFTFVTFEETAIETIEPVETVVVFAPLTPTPFPTPLPTATAAPVEAEGTWEETISALMENKCGACHGGGSALGGVDLGTYEAALDATTNSGPVILPGDPEGSVLVIVQAAGGHPGQFNGQELAQVRAWIEAGAPEE